MDNRTTDSTSVAASPADNAAERPGPSCTRASCSKPSPTETIPIKESLPGRVVEGAVGELSFVATLSLLALLCVDPDSMRALLVFSLSAIAVVMIGVIALIAMIKKPATARNVSKPDLPLTNGLCQRSSISDAEDTKHFHSDPLTYEATRMAVKDALKILNLPKDRVGDDRGK